CRHVLAPGLDHHGERRDADDDADAQREVAGFGAAIAPAGADLVAVPDHHRTGDQEQQRNAELGSRAADQPPVTGFLLFHVMLPTVQGLARKPALLSNSWCNLASLSRNFWKSAPVRKFSLKALRSENSFHSGVATIFFICSA